MAKLGDYSERGLFCQERTVSTKWPTAWSGIVLRVDSIPSTGASAAAPMSCILDEAAQTKWTTSTGGGG